MKVQANASVVPRSPPANKYTYYLKYSQLSCLIYVGNFLAPFRLIQMSEISRTP